jgi:tRNA pseudouridine55 synthase
VFRPLDGVLLLDKAQGVSSNGALQTARRLFRAAKGGHTGTLDPMATGLLPLCFGEATKFSQTLLDADKRYTAVVRLGVTTTTGDAEGEVLTTSAVTVTPAAIDAVVAQFRGPIEQVPPMYSALKHAGRPLYEYARAGLEIERAPRAVEIYALNWSNLNQDTFEIEVHCSKGTYIRTLACDMGAALGCGAHLIGLRRTAIGPFGVEEGLSLVQLEQMSDEAERDQVLRPTDALLAALPCYPLPEALARLFGHGQTVTDPTAPQGDVRIYANNRFLGLAQVDHQGQIKPIRLVAFSGN